MILYFFQQFLVLIAASASLSSADTRTKSLVLEESNRNPTDSHSHHISARAAEPQHLVGLGSSFQGSQLLYLRNGYVIVVPVHDHDLHYNDLYHDYDDHHHFDKVAAEAELLQVSGH